MRRVPFMSGQTSVAGPFQGNAGVRACLKSTMACSRVTAAQRVAPLRGRRAASGQPAGPKPPTQATEAQPWPVTIPPRAPQPPRRARGMGPEGPGADPTAARRLYFVLIGLAAAGVSAGVVKLLDAPMFRIYLEDNSPGVVDRMRSAGLLAPFAEAVCEVPREEAASRAVAAVLEAQANENPSSTTGLARPDKLDRVRAQSFVTALRGADVDEDEALRLLTGNAKSSSVTVDEAKTFALKALKDMDDAKAYFTLRDGFDVYWTSPRVRQMFLDMHAHCLAADIDVDARGLVHIGEQLLLPDDPDGTRAFFDRRARGDLDHSVDAKVFADFMSWRFEGTPEENIERRLRVWRLMAGLEAERTEVEEAAKAAGHDTTRGV